MPLLTDEGAIVHRHHFVLVAMYLLDTFLHMRSADGDFNPFWVAWAVINLNPDLGPCNQIQI
jgi:hypothetical protein